MREPARTDNLAPQGAASDPPRPGGIEAAATPGHQAAGATGGVPVRVWCDEVRVQLGLRRPRRRYREPLVDMPGQRLLFDFDV
jgi:hypothetical protein